MQHLTPEQLAEIKAAPAGETCAQTARRLGISYNRVYRHHPHVRQYRQPEALRAVSHELPDRHGFRDAAGGDAAIQESLPAPTPSTQLFQEMTDSFQPRTVEEQIAWLQAQAPALQQVKMLARQLGTMWRFKPQLPTAKLLLSALLAEMAHDRPKQEEQTGYSREQVLSAIENIHRTHPEALAQMGIQPIIGFVQQSGGMTVPDSDLLPPVVRPQLELQAPVRTAKSGA